MPSNTVSSCIDVGRLNSFIAHTLLTVLAANLRLSLLNVFVSFPGVQAIISCAQCESVIHVADDTSGVSNS